MIVQAIIHVFTVIVQGILSLLPTDDAPSWVASGAGYLAQLAQLGSGLAGWIPFPLAGTVITAFLACVLSGFIIKVVRIVASFFTAGGGSAA